MSGMQTKTFRVTKPLRIWKILNNNGLILQCQWFILLCYNNYLSTLWSISENFVGTKTKETLKKTTLCSNTYLVCPHILIISSINHISGNYSPGFALSFHSPFSTYSDQVTTITFSMNNRKEILTKDPNVMKLCI